jgi:hypothetical protein
MNFHWHFTTCICILRPQQGCTGMAITGWHISWVIQELNWVPSITMYMLFCTKSLNRLFSSKIFWWHFVLIQTQVLPINEVVHIIRHGHLRPHKTRTSNTYKGVTLVKGIGIPWVEKSWFIWFHAVCQFLEKQLPHKSGVISIHPIK